MPNVDHSLFQQEEITNFDILSQIIPPISIFKKSNEFKSTDDIATSNNVLEIKNGNYIRGILGKSAFGSTTSGLIQRIANDIGVMQSSTFIDSLQFIVNEFMKQNSYSVGISDLISNKTTNDKITTVIQDKKKDVKKLIDETHLGIFENNTGKSNQEEFESQVNLSLIHI